MVYDEDIPADQTWDVLRMRLFDEGHSLQDIDKLTFKDFGLIVGYKSGKQRGEEKVSQRNSRLSQGANKD